VLRIFQSIGAVVGLVFLAAGASAQDRLLSIDAIFDPDTGVNFSGRPPSGITWLDDATYLWPRQLAGRVDWLTVDAASGLTELLFDPATMEASLAAMPGISPEAAASLAHGRNLVFNPTHTAALVSAVDDLYLYDFGTGEARRLTDGPGLEEEASFSPDGESVAFVRGNDLYVVRVKKPRERAITKDGNERTLNGRLDWVYQEEIYGRGNFRGYWWSPDSTRLAFLRLDERSVPRFTRIDRIPYHPIPETGPYPKAGDANPVVRLGIAVASNGKSQWVDLSAYVGSEILVVKVGWSADSRSLVYQVQNRQQTWLDLNRVPLDGRGPQLLLHETTPAWVDAQDNPIWLDDGSFLWTSDRSGFRHLYHHRGDGSLIAPVTSGRWDIRSVHGLDSSGRVYFAGAEHSEIGRDIYRVNGDGTGLTRLSQTEGRHRALFNPSLTQYVGFWSDARTPTQVRLHDADGTEKRVIDWNQVAALAEYALEWPEFLQVTSRDGFVMEAMMIKPRDFDPTRRYPVYQETYAGPGTQSVLNAWRPNQLFLQLLAQNGVLVWVLDNRSASGKGAESRWPVHGRLGELELQDIEDGVTWLRAQPYVDGSRIVLGGWSYGGFMTAYALTHSTSFAAGIVGAPVTDWRNYDSVYTERYMKLPKHNPDGYARTAPTRSAARLHGRALLIHGSTDDNVHLQNTEQFASELQRAGKPFEMMVYPKSAHGVTEPSLRKHMHQLMFDFVMGVVGSSSPAAVPVALPEP
jgi:dipeptidyl-peptidase-4